MNKIELAQHRRYAKHRHTRITVIEVEAGPRPYHAATPKRVDLPKVRDLGHKLIGLTVVDAETNDELAALTIEEGRALDAIAFECNECELWFAAHERKVVGKAERWLCRECAQGECHE